MSLDLFALLGFKKRDSVLFKVTKIVAVLLSLVGAVFAWNFLRLIALTDGPVVVVLSGSMRPGFDRGDVLFMYNNPKRPYQVGDIIAFKAYDKDIPIVHRVLQVHTSPEGEELVLTKGDNNNDFDFGFYDYQHGQRLLRREDIHGRIVGMVPYLGMFTIFMTDYPWLKTAFIATIGMISFYDD